MATLPDYDYEHLFIDNASTDGTVAILRELAAADKRVKVIVNTRNFGHVRSPVPRVPPGTGDAVMSCVADLQDPPELIPEFVAKWEEGYKVVIGVKRAATSRGSWLRTRRFYYWLVAQALVRRGAHPATSPASACTTARSSSSSGTRRAVPVLPGPRQRLRVRASVRSAYASRPQPAARRKNNFFTLYDMAMLGITNHSKVPLRLATMAGFVISDRQPAGGARLPRR